MDANQLYEEFSIGKNESQKKVLKELINKHNLEFSRYKQDCRKRALDLAADLCRSNIAGVTSETISQEANKYYNWH